MRGSATPSDVSTDTPVIPGTGLAVSSRGSQGWLDPAHASAVAPGKRPRLTPSPALILGPGGEVTALGTPGGDVQLQAMLQVFLNMTVFGMSPQQAVEAPRFATQSFPDSFWPHRYFPGRMTLEGRIPDETAEALRAPRVLGSRDHGADSWIRRRRADIGPARSAQSDFTPTAAAIRGSAPASLPASPAGRPCRPSSELAGL